MSISRVSGKAGGTGKTLGAHLRIEQDLASLRQLFDAYARTESAVERQRAVAQLLHQGHIHTLIACELWLPFARRILPAQKHIELEKALQHLQFMLVAIEADLDVDESLCARMGLLQATFGIYESLSFPLIEGVRRTRLPLRGLGRQMGELSASLRLRWPYEEPGLFYIAGSQIPLTH
jgi:hypothetical protein